MKGGLHSGEDIPDNHAGASGHAAAEPLVYRYVLSGNPLGSTRRWRNDLDGRNRPDLIGCKCGYTKTSDRKEQVVPTGTIMEPNAEVYRAKGDTTEQAEENCGGQKVHAF